MLQENCDWSKQTGNGSPCWVGFGQQEIVLTRDLGFDLTILLYTGNRIISNWARHSNVNKDIWFVKRTAFWAEQRRLVIFCKN